MKTGLKNTFVLVAICAVMALLMAITNYATAPIIAENEAKATQKALQKVMPQGQDFTAIERMDSLPASITEVYTEANGGYVFKITTTGYGKGMVIMCGVNAEGLVTGTACLSSNETLGYEKTFGNQFVGADATDAAAVDTVAGATKTTAAYRSAVTDALKAAALLRAAEGV